MVFIFCLERRGKVELSLVLRFIPKVIWTFLYIVQGGWFSQYEFSKKKCYTQKNQKVGKGVETTF